MIDKNQENLKTSESYRTHSFLFYILAKDPNGAICIVEIKSNEDKSLIWQVLYYPKEVKDMYKNKEIRMMTVAPSYSKAIYDAMKTHPPKIARQFLRSVFLLE